MTNTSNDSLDQIIKTVKVGANQRVLNSIGLIIKICQEQERRGSSDFSVATIGGLSAESGGISTQSIRNDKHSRYKAIIEAYKLKNLKKPKAKKVREDDWIDRITDSNCKWLARDLEGKNKRLKSELATLKQAQQTVFLDLCDEPEKAHTGLNLTDTEIRALKDFISERRFIDNGWQRTEQGQIVDEDGVELSGFRLLNAIEKILTVDPNHG